MSQVLLLLVKVRVKDNSSYNSDNKFKMKITVFITVIMQTRLFSLNLGTSNTNFKTTKYSLEISFEKE